MSEATVTVMETKPIGLIYDLPRAARRLDVSVRTLQVWLEDGKHGLVPDYRDDRDPPSAYFLPETLDRVNARRKAAREDPA